MIAPLVARFSGGFLIGALAAAPLVAQPTASRLRWRPARVVQGALIELELTPAAGDRVRAVHGELAGEPLHFGGGSVLTSLAGIPVDAGDTLATTLVIEHAARVETLSVHIPVSRGAFKLEHLTVAPQFGTEPDSITGARIARELERARALARRSHDTPRLWRGPFLAPRPGRVTSRFGGGREFNGAMQTQHMGVDFAGTKGAPIRATNRGVVVLVDDFFLGGHVVYIDHGGGLVTGYLHMTHSDVAEGDTVTRGQVIGRVGSSGRATGPHLHWAVRYGNITVDGLSLLSLERR